jgi:hypothetical protein
MTKEEKINVEITARTIDDFQLAVEDLSKLPESITNNIKKAEVNWHSKIITYDCHTTYTSISNFIVVKDVTKVIINKHEITVYSSENNSITRVFKTKFVENIEIIGINLKK